MPSQSTGYRPSPLDSAMRRFLVALPAAASPVHAREVLSLAGELDVPVPFVEALFLSARRRGLIHPEPAGRGKYTWTVSKQGQALIESLAEPAVELAD